MALAPRSLSLLTCLALGPALLSESALAKEPHGKRPAQDAGEAAPLRFDEPGLILGFARVHPKNPFQVVEALTRCDGASSFRLRARFTLTRDDGNAIEKLHERTIKAHWCKGEGPEAAMALVELEPNPAHYTVVAEVFYSYDGKKWTSIGKRSASFEVTDRSAPQARLSVGAPRRSPA